MAEKFIITADRARLRIYRYAQAAGQFTPSLQPVNTTESAPRGAGISARAAGGASSRTSTFPSRVGGYPLQEHVGTHAEQVQPPTAEELAAQIATFLEKRADSTWDFGAPAAIQNEILDALPESVRRRLDRIVTKDVVNLPPVDLRSHFAL